mgnify:CR=1 FL=1
MRMLCLLTVSVAAASCDQSPEWPSSGQYAGYYKHGFEVSEFVPAGSTEKWWLNGSIPCLPVNRQNAELPVVYLEVQGVLSQKGRHGHLGAYTRELQVSSVAVCKVVGPGASGK